MGAVVPLYIKTAYHEEPSYANTKVVTSLFTKSMMSDLGSNFKQCVVFKEAKADLLKKYSDQFTFDELAKLAIDYSDGVIAAHKDVSKDLLKYATDNNIPTLDYPGEDFAQAYEEFYEKI
jgi:starch synthase